MHNHGLGSWMAKRRLKTPNKTAIVHGDHETMTYRELAEAADQTSAVLRHRDVGKGDRVAYLGGNTPEFFEVLFGAAQLGAVFVPVNTRLAPPEIAHVLADSGARAIVVAPEHLERLTASGVSVPHVIVTGEGTPALPGLAALLRTAGAGHTDEDVTMSDPAAIVYTSGTTGFPKGATLTHENLTWVAINTVVDYDVVSTDVALMISPLFHVAALGMGALPVILKGGTLVLETRFDAEVALAQIARHRVTMLSGVPTTFEFLCQHPDWDSTDLTSLTKLTCGGSPVPISVLNAYEERGMHFSQGYGMTETSPGATALAPEMTRAKQGSVGLAHFFTDVRIADEHGAMVPRGTVGEIEISGPNVFAGYHGLPDDTAKAFTADGWFRSGDLGYLDRDGYLYITGRLKDMIISGGENIYPAEIETLLLELDGVTGAAVIGIPDDRWGEVPWAVLTVRDGADIDLEAVRAHLEGHLARYKLPKQVVVVDSLPRTATGKVRKADLRARFGG